MKIFILQKETLIIPLQDTCRVQGCFRT